MTDTCDLCTATVKDAFVCERCGDGYANDLKALVEWLHEELETTMAGTRGATPPEFGGAKTIGSADANLRINWTATETYRRLHQTLNDTVEHCLEVGTTHRSPRNDNPARTVPAMALWLTWRVDGLCLDPQGPRLVGELVRLSDRAQEIVVWEPPERRFLGPCEICGEGHVYAEGDDVAALCDRCEAAFPAEARRLDLVSRMDDQLLTIAEMAGLSTHLGLRENRKRVEWLLAQWHRRKRISAHGHNDKGNPVFRFGEVRPMLTPNEGEAAVSG